MRIPPLLPFMFMMFMAAMTALFLSAWSGKPGSLLAVPMGFLFGFIIQKGFLCPASACSEVLLFRSWERLAGLGCCIVTSMLGYALIELTGWVTLDSRPLNWLSLAVGGLLFGTGMVLAGGCIVGTLFKAGTGNLNSLAALPAVMLGVYVVREGWLRSLDSALREYTVQSSEGEAVSLMRIIGVPYPLLAGIPAALILFVAALSVGGAPIASRKSIPFRDVLRRSWRPWKAGIAIGILAPMACLGASAAGYFAPLGATDGVMNALHMVLGKSHTGSWPVLFCTALMAGAWFSGRLSGQSRILPKPPGQVGIAILGGVLLGMGAALADGCFYGNIITGWAQLSVGGFLFALVTIPAAWVTTYFYLLGGPAAGWKRKGVE